MTNKICIISGPTASGKTQTSIDLAKKYGGEIINFDSLLFYKEINIGTAKPTKEEQEGIPHHLINIRSISEPINASDYLKLALPIIRKLHSENKIVFLVGGSGFYLQALLYGMFESETTPKNILERSEELYQNEGIKPFMGFLKQNDPVSFKLYHENDHYRVRRAVEHFWTNNSPFSEKRELMLETREKNSNIKRYGWDYIHIYLDLPKNDHLDIINKRTINMLESGLISEVESLLSQGYTGNEKPLNSIGYKESIAFVRNELTENEMIERINISTRQLAKAQRTWFKKVEKKEFNPLTQTHKIEEYFESFAKSK
jgi:tRNA dimethylallyltransferase